MKLLGNPRQGFTPRMSRAILPKLFMGAEQPKCLFERQCSYGTSTAPPPPPPPPPLPRLPTGVIGWQVRMRGKLGRKFCLPNEVVRLDMLDTTPLQTLEQALPNLLLYEYYPAIRGHDPNAGLVLCCGKWNLVTLKCMSTGNIFI